MNINGNRSGLEAVQLVSESTQKTEHTFRDELKQWRTLLRRRESLARAIDRQREIRIELKLSIEPGGIQSSIIQQYKSMLLGLPRGSEVSDKTGDMVANTDDRLQRADVRMEQTLTDYLDTCDRITAIEVEVGMLGDDKDKPYRSVVTDYYREGKPWYDIVDERHVTKSTVYRWLDEAIDIIDHSLWRC